MKKTITASLLSLGFAVAASAETATVVAPSLTYTEFTSTTQTVVVGDTTYAYHSGSYTRAPQFNADGSATFTNDILNIYASSGTADLGVMGGPTGTTITMTLSGLSYGSATDAGNHAIFTATVGDYKWGVGLNADGKLIGTWNNAHYGADVFDVPTSGTFTLTATIGTTDTAIYADGVLLGTISGLSASTGLGNLEYLMIGSESSSTNAGADFTIHNLYVHNRKLSDTEVAAFVSSISVPEPATASLSLLALAGLAARRRRK